MVWAVRCWSFSSWRTGSREKGKRTNRADAPSAEGGSWAVRLRAGLYLALAAGVLALAAVARADGATTGSAAPSDSAAAPASSAPSDSVLPPAVTPPITPFGAVHADTTVRARGAPTDTTRHRASPFKVML